MTVFDNVIKWCVVGAFVLGSSLAVAGEPLLGTEQKMDTRAMSLAGAQRVSSANTTGVYLNPAMMSMARVYHIGLHYQYTGRDMLHHPGIVFLDSITSQWVAAGLSIDYVKDSKPRRDFESWDGRLALSMGLGDRLYVGLTGRYLRAASDLKADSVGPNGMPALERDSHIQANGFTMDVGTIVRLGSLINLGLVGQNLVKSNSQFAPVTLTPGISALIAGMWNVEADVLIDFTSHKDVAATLMIGSELVLQQQFSIRLGYNHDFFNRINRVGGGIGYAGTQAAIDLGYLQDVEYPGRVRLSLGFRFFLN